MQHLHIDLETYSDADLPKVGAYRYAQDPSTRVLLLAYSYGDSVHLLDLAHGDELPDQLRRDLADPNVQKWAHNANFERAVISNVLGIPCPPEQWRCSMAWAMSLSLPGGLGSLSTVLKLKADAAKLTDGRRLIHKFCTPRGAKQRDLDNSDWLAFCEYCRQDVRAEMAVVKRLRRYQMPDQEWTTWTVDQHINDNGLPIDLNLVEAVRSVADDHRVSIETLARDVTGLDNPNSRQQMIAWMEQNGVNADDLTSGTVDTLLTDRNLPPLVRQALECRQQLAKASISKYDALFRATGTGDRLRGAFQYAGAGRTGRWAGRIFQPQNLPRPSLSDADIDQCRQIIRTSDADTMAMLYDDLSGALSSLIRSSISAPAGRQLVVADYSSIESIMIAWCAESEYLLNLYRNGLDPYKDFATKVYNIEYTDVTKQQRSFCKPAVLGAGYGLSGPGLQRYAAAFGMDMDAKEAKRQIDTFRSSYADIPAFWAKLDAAVQQAMNNRGKPIDAGRFRFTFDGLFLVAAMPSGRSLYYYQPKLGTNDWGRSELTYMGREPGTRISTHPGKIVENLVQAVARDLLAHGLIETHRAGFEIIGHVHDEILVLADADDETALQRLEKAMTTTPEWCYDAPIKAEGYDHAAYYRKD